MLYRAEACVPIFQPMMFYCLQTDSETNRWMASITTAAPRWTDHQPVQCTGELLHLLPDVIGPTCSGNLGFESLALALTSKVLVLAPDGVESPGLDAWRYATNTMITCAWKLTENCQFNLAHGAELKWETEEAKERKKSEVYRWLVNWETVRPKWNTGLWEEKVRRWKLRELHRKKTCEN